MKVIKFEAAWCNPCKVATNVLNDKGIDFEAIDIEAEKELTEQFGILSIPTVVVLDSDNQEVDRYVGLPNIMKMGE